MVSGDVVLNDVGSEIFQAKYASPGEQVYLDRCKVVAKSVAGAELSDKVLYYEKKFLEALRTADFIPGGRILFGAGRNSGNQNLLNCYSLVPQDSVESIGQMLHNMYKISCAGGGIGFYFGHIRPKGDDIQNIKNSAPGTISDMEMVDTIGERVRSGASRRTALLAILPVTHPDILEFLTVKLDKEKLTNFNISVGVTDRFIQACEEDEDWYFTFKERKYFIYEMDRITPPNTKHAKTGDLIPETETIHVVALNAEDAVGRAKNFYNTHYLNAFSNVTEKVFKARDIWNIIWENSVETGCPGIFNMDMVKTHTNVSYFEELLNPNPCIVGDTKVYVADGRGAVTIKELADKGDDVPAFCLDDEGKVAVKTMRHPRVTGRNKKILKVTLDSGDSVRVTENHKFRLLDGDYVEAKDLIMGDQLFVLERRKAKFFEVMNQPGNENISEYFWLRDTQQKVYKSEHRKIYEDLVGPIPKHHVIHHVDYDSQNNRLDNLQCMSSADHNQLHAQDMIGDLNPMRRAKTEWSEEKWESYKQKHSDNNTGAKNKNSKDLSNEELYAKGVEFSKELGRIFSKKEWIEYAGENNLPKSFSAYRKNALGSLNEFSKTIAEELNFRFIDEDPRLVKSFQSMEDNGYKPIIKNGMVLVNKTCELCKKEFHIDFLRREQGFCSSKCGGMIGVNKAKSPEALEKRLRGLEERRQKTRLLQFEVFKELGNPLKADWQAACKAKGISPEIGRKSSPFKSYSELKEYSLAFNHKVVSITEDGYEDVYNGTVDDYHNYFMGGFISNDNEKSEYWINSKNCGEIPLPDKGNCCLGHVNLANMVRYDSFGVMEFDWSKFAKTIRIGVRFLDNVLTINNFPNPECREVGHNSRRIGLGVTGLHHMLIKLGYVYGSPKCLDFLDRVGRAWRNTAYTTSALLAREKGAFPAYNKKKFSEEGFFKTLPTQCRKQIHEHGIRNAVMLTVAPVGTTSFMLGLSSGLEPIFSAISKRRWRQGTTWKESIILDPLFKEYYDKKKSIEPFVGAYDVTPEQHMAVQAVWQQYTDNSISKTINLPKDFKAEDLSDIALGYIKELKGLTIYREGSKGEEPLIPIPLTPENIKLYVDEGYNTSTEATGVDLCPIDGACG